MKKKIIKFMNTVLEVLEFVLAGVIILVLACVIGIEIYRLCCDPAAFMEPNFLNTFLTSITNLVVAVEFVKMLLRPTAFNILELLIMALSRYVVLNHHDHWAIAIGVACIVALFVVRHMLVAKSYKEEVKEDEQLMKTKM